ncbi:MAG: hypothetical protein M3O46_03205 [Myxococcota bacterium]|nr:hypothetical protein [Myxococcota bacterium]
MARGWALAFAVAGFLGFGSGCTESSRESVLFMSWNAGRYAPLEGNTLLHVDADRGSFTGHAGQSTTDA